MIDKGTGEIMFPGWNESLSRRTTREMFEQLSLVQNASIQVRNEPYCSWRLKPVQWEGGKWWTIIIYFEGDRLYQVLLAASDDETDPRWEEWSEESERHKKEYYSRVLEKLFGNDRQFQWGTVEATYDGRSGSSSIIINY